MKIKKKRRKSGQAMIEFVFVLGLYFFLLGFMFSGFQIMYSKTLLSISAYNGVRYSSLYQGDIAQAKKEAQSVLTANVFKNTGIVDIQINNSGIYSTCIVSQDIKLLFPIIDPNNITSILSSKQVKTQFTMRNER